MKIQPYILLVEDNQDDEQLALMAFEQFGQDSRIEVVRDGAEAIEFLEGSGRHVARDAIKPRVVLLDLNLPKIGGLEVLQWMRSREATRSIPVVVLTSSKEQPDMLSSYRFGANSYVRKPVDFEEFQETMRSLGKYWLVLNQLPDAKES